MPGRSLMGEAVVLDADVLVPFLLSDFVLTASSHGLIGARASTRILDGEALPNRRDIVERQLIKRFTERGMRADRVDAAARTEVNTYMTYLRRNMITGAGLRIVDHPGSATELELKNHWKDRHVLATAIDSGVAVILTNNLKDFRAEHLEPHGVAAMTPDSWFEMLAIQEPREVRNCVAAMADRMSMPMPTLMERLKHPARVPKTMKVLEEGMDPGRSRGPVGLGGPAPSGPTIDRRSEDGPSQRWDNVRRHGTGATQAPRRGDERQASADNLRRSSRWDKVRSAPQPSETGLSP